MIKSILVLIILLGTAFSMSHFFILYPHAGKKYISKHREQRKSLRHGSGFIYMGRGFRGGK